MYIRVKILASKMKWPPTGLGFGDLCKNTKIYLAKTHFKAPEIIFFTLAIKIYL